MAQAWIGSSSYDGGDRDEGVSAWRLAEADLRACCKADAANRDARHELERVLAKLKRHAQWEGEQSKKVAESGRRAAERSCVR